MRPNVIDIDPAAVDDNGIADDLGTGASWSLSGDAEWLASSSGDGLAHQLIVTTAGNEPAGNSPVLTLVGTDADGKVQTETVTLPNATTVETTKYFLTVTSGTTQAATIDTMDIGWVDEVASPTYPIDRMSDEPANILVDVTGTVNFTVQELWENVYDVDNPQQDATWINIAALAAKTADTASQSTEGATAIRVILNTYSTGAELQMHTNQPINGSC